MDRNATRQASGGGGIGCAPAGKAITHATPWAPYTISGNRSIPRRPTPCARRSTTPGGTWRHRATFSAHDFQLIGRAKGSPSASPTWCSVANAIPTISPRMRSTTWRDELHYEDNGVETRLVLSSPYLPASMTPQPMDFVCTAKAPVIGRAAGACSGSSGTGHGFMWSILHRRRCSVVGTISANGDAEIGSSPMQ